MDVLGLIRGTGLRPAAVKQKKKVEKVQRKQCRSVYVEVGRRCERKRKQKGSPTSQSETDPGEDWVAPSPFAI